MGKPYSENIHIARKVKIWIENMRKSSDNSLECLFSTVTNWTKIPLIFGVIYFFKVDSGISTELRDGKRKSMEFICLSPYAVSTVSE